MHKTLWLVGVVFLTGCAPSLEGTWVSNCFKRSGVSLKDVIVVSGSEYRQSTTGYADECATERGTTKVVGKWELIGELDGSDGVEKLNQTVETVKLNPATVAVADSFSQSDFCGVATWTQGQDHDVTGRKCGEDQIDAAGAINYQIMKLEEKDGKDTLTFGDTAGGKDASGEEKRPTVIDTAIFYTRQ